MYHKCLWGKGKRTNHYKVQFGTQAGTGTKKCSADTGYGKYKNVVQIQAKSEYKNAY